MSTSLCHDSVDQDVRIGKVETGRLPAAHGRRAALHRVLVVDLPVGPALQHLVERDAALEARERGTETEVQPVAEAQVVTDLAVDVEAVAVGEPPVVAVRRPVEQHHDAALGNDLAVVLDVARDVARLDGRRRLEAEELLDRLRDERAVGRDLAPLVGVLGEHLAGPADEPRGRLVPGRRRAG